MNTKCVSNFHKDEKPFRQTNNDTSKSKVGHDNQILSEVTVFSNTHIMFDTPIDRLKSNETSNLDKPIMKQNEAKYQQMVSNETPNVNTPTDNSRETESQLVTSNETVNESNKNAKAFYKTPPDNSEIDTTKLKKGQILSFKTNGNKVEILGRASKATGKYHDWINALYHYPNTEKGKSGSIGFYDVVKLKFVENTEESITEISNYVTTMQK